MVILHGDNGLDPDTSYSHMSSLCWCMDWKWPCQEKCSWRRLTDSTRRFWSRYFPYQTQRPIPQYRFSRVQYPQKEGFTKELLTYLAMSADSRRMQLRNSWRENSFRWQERSCYISIKDILLKYSLPSTWELLDLPPAKVTWKRQVTKSVKS